MGRPGVRKATTTNYAQSALDTAAADFCSDSSVPNSEKESAINIVYSLGALSPSARSAAKTAVQNSKNYAELIGIFQSILTRKMHNSWKMARYDTGYFLRDSSRNVILSIVDGLSIEK